MSRSEEFLKRLTVVERSIVLSGHEANILDLELARDFAELRKALPPLLRIVGRVRKIAGKYDEIGLIGEAVYGGDRFFQRPFGIGIGRSLKSPVRIGELHKIEVIGCLSVFAGCLLLPQFLKPSSQIVRFLAPQLQVSVCKVKGHCLLERLQLSLARLGLLDAPISLRDRLEFVNLRSGLLDSLIAGV